MFRPKGRERVGVMHTIGKRIWTDVYRLRYVCVILFIYGAVAQILFGTVCPFVIIFGFPCPACGLTRACLAILTGNFKAAVTYHLMAFFWMAWIFYLIVNRYICGRKLRHPALNTAFCIIISVVTIVYYVYRMKYFFPGEPPLTYSENNIVEWLLEM